MVADCRGSGGRHDHRQNASYALVNLLVFHFLRVLLGRDLTRRLLRPHNKRLGVKTYKNFYKLKDFPKEMRNYYKLKSNSDMLLSRRADMNECGYSCCTTCNNSMHKRDRKKKPPKLSIANGFVIGKFSKLTFTDNNGEVCDFSVELDLTDVMRAMLPPTQTHGYVMVFMGKKHKSVKGHNQFFEMDQTRVGGAINHIRHNETRQYIFCVLSGRMTPQQETTVKKKCVLDTNLDAALSTWFIKTIWSKDICKSSNPRTMSTASYYHG